MMTNFSGWSHEDRIDCIQGLRAIAAIAVVVAHLNIPSLAIATAWGVDLFFVISGFIVCYVTEKSTGGFLIKRVIRVIPLYWGGTLGVFFLALVVPSLFETTTADAGQLIKSLLFIPYKKGDEFSPILFQGWTINYEMFFYSLFALSMWINHRHRVGICSMLIVGAVVGGRLFPFDLIIMQFFTGTILLEFVFGMLCYTALWRLGIYVAKKRSMASRVAWTALALVLIVCISIPALNPVVEDRVARYGVISALSFICVLYGLWGIKLPGPVVLLGDASYCLYLAHPYFTKVIEGALRSGFAFLGSPVGQTMYECFTAGLVLVLSCLVSMLFYKSVEEPVTRYLRARLVKRCKPDQATAC